MSWLPRIGAGVLIAAAVVACGQSSAPPSDPYDVSKMDLKPMPARVSTERHTGAFAEGRRSARARRSSRWTPRR